MGLPLNQILVGDALAMLRTLPDESVHCVVTSPPYWGLRDYGCVGQIGLEDTPQEYLERLVGVFAEVRRVLRSDGTCWINIGNVWRCGQALGLPWRLALALQDDGWRLRQDIIWSKPNTMPESVPNRCCNGHEYIFLLSKSNDYWFETIKEPAVSSGPQNSFARKSTACPSPVSMPQHREDRDDIEYSGSRTMRSVWTIPTRQFRGAHFAVFPPALVERCIKAGCPAGGIVLDPFVGSGTTALVAAQLGRDFVGIELNPDYVRMAEQRLHEHCGLLMEA